MVKSRYSALLMLFYHFVELFMDEPTEKLAMELPHERLKGRTIISIAHQINTVIDSDLIMAIYYGTVSEMGAP